ncbi:uncharacterized protein LOC122505576 [Leptopilina heterotoma]|uniref:uncharacterized protein LOC122505576 n=1 Tax=Leptopilina heterotoma TaxID=63436 RepID=UPI001CA8E9F7|nr:uncharacterized protein LOC122505576 [Leptopilina heterotoma]
MESLDRKEGEFVYLSIKTGLHRCIDTNIHDGNLIELKFNVDGLPISKSSDLQLWPTLCQVHHEAICYQPFAVSIFCGMSKPISNDVYFEEFVSEMNDLLENGIDIEGKHYRISIKCFVCDTPARAFCKNIVGHNHKFGCERCIVKGTKRGFKQTVFLSTNSAERTDDSFRNQSQIQHHKGHSLLSDIRLPMNMIFTFVLDFMHLCFLGVMKKLLFFWLEGNLNFRLRSRLRNALSDRMELLKNEVPCEFQRKPRSTKKYKKWKATEFRFFLLYCGPIILKKILSKRLYKHFLLLHCACRILSMDNICIRLNGFAKTFLVQFVKGAKSFYGKSSLTMNLHNLLHVADDARTMNCSLTKISCFPFENFLGKLKVKLRSPLKPLAQICRRLHEEANVINQKGKISPAIDVLKAKQNNILKIKFKEYTLTAKEPDNIVLLKNRKFLKIKKIVKNRDDIEIRGQYFKGKKPIYVYPFKSTALNMWEIYPDSLEELHTFPLSFVDKKGMKLSASIRDDANKRYYLLPLIH